ncbi:cobaltochelatase subunit CobN [Schlesneria sp. T3-172]|uniref:cobaltochelatase subunit CobN n=1 Tax=Schlesneria sphaerica TaxID=3373610 RepID=UPI0037C75C6F
MVLHSHTPSQTPLAASGHRFRVLMAVFAASLLGLTSAASISRAQTATTASPASSDSDPPVPAFEIGFIGLHGGVYEQLQTYAKPLNLRLTYFEDGDVANKRVDLSTVRLLYIQHTREEDRDTYRLLLDEATRKNPGLRVFVLPANAVDFFRTMNLKQPVERDSDAANYYGSSAENLRRMLIFIAARRLGHDLQVEPPQEVEREGLYHPDHEGFFPSSGAFEVWSRTRGTFSPEKPRLLITVHNTHLAFQQPRVVDALIREAERQGAVAVGIIDGRSKTYEEQAVAFAPHAVIHTCHSGDTVALRNALNVPHLHSIFIRKQSIAEWQESTEGLSSSELAFHIIGQELIGGIEPQVAAGTTSGQGSAEAFQPIPDRVEHLIKRALGHARMAQTPAPQKKIAIIYYDREMGKGELMRGSSTGMHLNGPRSLTNVLQEMQKHGYQMTSVPRHEDELLMRMIERGRQIGVWAPAELDRLVQHGDPVLVSEDDYRVWYEKFVPADRRQQMEDKWGPPPGQFMVWQRDGRKHLVIPRIELGNVILLPQPLRGEIHGKEGANAQAHDKVTTPPHNYLATYFWLEHQFHANALIHFGTHGSEFALPGKPNGLSQRDWCDVIMGSMPNFNPWIIENMVESSPVRRRVYGTLLSHLPPPIVDAGLSDDLANLHETLDKWETLEEGALKENFREEITRQVQLCHLETDLHLTIPDDGKLTRDAIRQVSDYLHAIQEETTPTSLHVYGERPRSDLLIPYMVTILRTPFINGLKELKHDQQHQANRDHDHEGHSHGVRPEAEAILQLVLNRQMDPLDAVNATLGTTLSELPEAIDKGLKLAIKLNADFDRTADEIGNLLAGLEGKFVPPSPGNSPIRNPGAVPTGRNMYLLNPEEIPSRPSWELGHRLAEELVTRHQTQTGQFPTKVGFDLRSSATFRDYGVMEAQILRLIGIEPVWDERQLVSDVKLISRDDLGRPRVDVFIAAGSWYESNLPSRLNLWDKAIRLATQADEPDNPLFQNTQTLRTTLVGQGLTEDRAQLLSHARIFGRAPGRESGSFLGYKVAQSGDWNSRDDIAAEYLAHHKHVYTEGAWGEEASPLYDAAIQGTHTVVRSWSDHMTSPLASKYVWLHGGSLSLAVEALTGKKPEFVLSDVRDPDKAGLISAEDALRREYRVRLFNRKWLEGMMKEGYAGADQIRFMTSNSFGWEVMRPGSVGSENWQEMKQVLIDDKLNLRLPDWMDRNNPYAYQDSMAVMLEAMRKGYWQADEQTRQQVARAYAENVARHGMSGHMTSGGNTSLDTMVREQLEGIQSPTATRLLANYTQRFNEQTERTAVDIAAGTTAPGTAPSDAAATDAVPPPAMDPASTSTQATTPFESTNAPATPLTTVEGQRLQPSPSPSIQHQQNLAPAPVPPGKPSLLYWSLGAAILLLMVAGFAARRGTP